MNEQIKTIEQIREFFKQRQVTEVSTPLLCKSTIPDPYIESFKVGDLYLQTSPEFEMKKLLAQGSGDIYQICKAFRKEEIGRLHNIEFTMLEWYRINFNHHDLMNDMEELLQLILNMGKAQRISYKDLFIQHLNLDPHTATLKELEDKAKQENINIEPLDNKDDWLNLLLTHSIEPKLGFEQPVFIYDYPTSQSALARINNDVAERFEVYVKGIELANGFHELNDSSEQRERFLKDMQSRKEKGMDAPPLDEDFLQAVDQLPDCAGVALGIDRLTMLACKQSCIS